MNPMELDWWTAVLAGDGGRLRYMLRDGIDVDIRDAEGWSALMFAALDGRVDLALPLISHGADINARSFGGFAGMTPLMIASSRGHYDFVKLLLDYTADFRQVGPFGGTALAFASFHGHLSVMRLLIDRGADMLAGNIYEPFHEARYIIYRRNTASELGIKLSQ